MNKKVQIILTTVAVMTAFMFGWFVKALDGVGWNYIEETVNNQEQHISMLHDYVKNRRDTQTDLIALQNLNLINDNQYDGKYAPWIRTKLGLIKLDESGFITKICFTPSGLNNPDCPPQL